MPSLSFLSALPHGFAAHGFAAKSTAGRLALLRGLTVLAMLALTALAPALLVVAVPRGPLLGVAAALAVVWLGDVLGRRRGGAGLSPAHGLWLDVLAWSAFLFFTGGATNPLISALLPLVAIGAAVLPAVRAWQLGLFAIAAYSFLWQFYLPLQIADANLAVRLHLLGMWLTFAVSTLVAIWFISRMTSALRARDRALAAAREQALRHDWLVSLGSLAAGAAHELSTPLATIALLTEELQAGPLNDAQLADLRLLQTQVAACKQSLSRLTAQAGQVRAGESEALSVADWLEEQAVRWRTLHPQVLWRISIAAELARCCCPQRPGQTLAQALHNLVDNAVAAGGVGQPVEVRAEWLEAQAGQEEQLRVEVRDYGPGLPPELRQRLQQGRLDDGDGPLPSRGGLGIGLLLTQGSIARHGGRWQFLAPAGGGTAVVVHLPVARLVEESLSPE